MLVVAAVLRVFTFSWSDILSIMMPAYLLGFAIVIVSFEYRIPVVQEHFSFLDSVIGRGLFNI
jgi:hypothetical protein